MLFRWRKEIGLGPLGTGATFLPVQIVDDGSPSVDAMGTPDPALPAAASPPAVVVERPAPAIEIALVGGRRLRVERDIDPETVRRLVAALAGGGP